MKFDPRDYQRRAIEWMLQRTLIEGHKGCGLLFDPGLGKTATVLTWLKALKLFDRMRSALVIAPKRVCYEVWPEQASEWDHVSDMTVSIVHGTPAVRKRRLAEPADLHVINPDGLQWLWKHRDGITADVLAVDESTDFRNWSSKRMRVLKKLLPRFRHRVIMTGTPTPKSIGDLFAQCYILDDGEALGTGITKFRRRWFHRGGFKGYDWLPTESAVSEIQDAIGHMVMRLDAADHLDLPELITNDVWVSLAPDARREYDHLERKLFLALEDGNELTPLNAGAKYNLCRQLAGGGVYGPDGVLEYHTAKIDAVCEIVDGLAGKPALIAYQYRHDLDRLRRKWRGLPAINGQTSEANCSDLIHQWNDGRLPLLAVQPQAMSHGINMQHGPGRDIIWFGLIDDLGIYQQLNARVYRQGVTSQVRVHRVLARSTVDVVMRRRIDSKEQSQAALLDLLKTYRHQKGDS